VLGLDKSILWIVGGQVVGLLNNFLLLKLLTTNLSITAYGYFTLWMSVMLFVRQLIYDPLSIVAAKEVVNVPFLGLKGVSGFQVVKYLTDRIMFGLVLVGALSVVGEMVFYKHISTTAYILMGCIYLVANGAQGIYLNMLNALKQRKWASIGIAADSLVKLCLVLLVFFLWEKSVIAAVQAVAISSLLVFIGVQHATSHRFDRATSIAASVKWPPAKQLVVLSIPFFVPTLLTALKGLGDKVFMASFIGVDELAAYNVLLQLGFIPMMLIVGVIQTFVSPDIYKLASDTTNYQDKTLAYIKGIVIRIGLLSVVAITFSLLLSHLMFEMLVGAKYTAYSMYLPYFVLAGAIGGIAGLLNVGIIGIFKPKRVASLMVISVLAGLVILIILMMMYGFEGAIAGLILSNLFMMFIFGYPLVASSSKINKIY
jgi:O-antigen/teichoic acid export membrane protein